MNCTLYFMFFHVFLALASIHGRRGSFWSSIAVVFHLGYGIVIIITMILDITILTLNYHNDMVKIDKIIIPLP